MDLQTALRVEQEKMTRRAALRKFGFGAGLAAFSLLGVDDIARMVGKRMERMAGDNKVAGQIAKEFQGAGIAFAAGPSYGGGGGGNPGCGSPPSTCQHCANQMHLDNCYCVDTYGGNGLGSNPNPTLYTHCINQMQYNYEGCSNCWCAPNQYPSPSNPFCPPTSSQQPPQGCNC